MANRHMELVPLLNGVRHGRPESENGLSAELNELLLQDHDISSVLNSLAQLAVERLSVNRRVPCGIVLTRDRKNTVVASSSPQAQQMDEVQAGFDEGPCLEAQRSNTVIRVPDIRHEKRWPHYKDEVRRHGLRSVLAVPLVVNTNAAAVMNFYTHEPGAFYEEDAVTAHRYVDAPRRSWKSRCGSQPKPRMLKTGGPWSHGLSSTSL